jgi:hypothetical protein
MRNRLLSTALGLGLALGIGFAGAQTINKALQLSQDATGAFSVDSFNGVYFPGHILSPTGGARPAPTVGGGGTTPTITGTDTAATVTMGTSATTATVTFGTAYVSVPACVVSWQTPETGVISPITYTLATTSIALTQGAATGNKINFMCMSAS